MHPHDDRGGQGPDQDRDLLLPGRRADQEAGLEVLRGRAAVGRRDADDARDRQRRQAVFRPDPAQHDEDQAGQAAAWRSSCPEIGLDDEPITPVIRELTVTNRNPNKHDHARRR